MNTGMKRMKGRVIFKTYDKAEEEVSHKWISKEKRRLWWNSLTAEEQEAYIAKKNKNKTRKRQDKLKLFKAISRFNCMNCLHHKTGNCQERDKAENMVCKSFVNPELFSEPIRPVREVCGSNYIEPKDYGISN